MSVKIIDGREIAKNLRLKTAKEIEKLKDKYECNININTIKIGSDPASEIYLKLREKACREVGISTSRTEFLGNVTEKEVLDSIKDLNNDKNVHGILVQFPVPKNISQDKIVNTIDPRKDVEGLTPYNIGNTLIGLENIVPCTPLAVLKILEHENIELKGKNIAIVNHSNIVGKPLAALLLNRNATVSICHVFTKDIKPITSKADILITAAGVPKLITKDHIKNDALVIDVAITNTVDGIVGDIDFQSVKEKAAKITPVPGGVGPVTVACSLINMTKTFRNCLDVKDR
ncbi:MAG: bifunctional 5,10-methylenetetrahydrofolate dehydrogenase/5,10-methenyltetrahydrofolate cyclohydrolase [Candidatus Thermoplasmatota archaeon]|nr:bifunctional 5,10-methylenetetrahydrofolate dehydrogenase/5,10-methenyltetrahydrofolate cyclohydrolase [Candidatus Thermoplasmatota archaeon]